MNGRDLIGATIFDVAVDCVVAAVHLGIGIPFIQIIALIEQRLSGGFDPVDRFGLIQPIGFGVVLP